MRIQHYPLPCEDRETLDSSKTYQIIYRNIIENGEKNSSNNK